MGISSLNIKCDDARTWYSFTLALRGKEMHSGVWTKQRWNLYWFWDDFNFFDKKLDFLFVHHRLTTIVKYKKKKSFPSPRNCVLCSHPGEFSFALVPGKFNDGVYANIWWLITEITLEINCVSGKGDKSPCIETWFFFIQFHIEIDFFLSDFVSNSPHRRLNSRKKIDFALVWSAFRWTFVRKWFIKLSDRNLHLICDFTCSRGISRTSNKEATEIMPKPQRKI